MEGSVEGTVGGGLGGAGCVDEGKLEATGLLDGGEERGIGVDEDLHRAHHELADIELNRWRDGHGDHRVVDLRVGDAGDDVGGVIARIRGQAADEGDGPLGRPANALGGGELALGDDLEVGALTEEELDGGGLGGGGQAGAEADLAGVREGLDLGIGDARRIAR